MLDNLASVIKLFLTMSTDKHSHIEALNNSNYSEWRINIFGWMLQHHLEEFITSPHPSIPNLGSPAYDHFINRRNEASGVLLQKINQKAKTRFVTQDNMLNPNELWDAISDHYASKKSPNQGRVFNSFIRLTFTTLTLFINDIRQGLTNIVDCEVNKKISDDLLAEMIVHKFPESLSTMQEILLDKRPLTTEKVLDALDQHLAEEHEKKDKESTVYALQRNTFGSQFSRSSSQFPRSPSAYSSTRIFCSNGVHNEKTKHSREDCYQLHPEKRNNRNRRKSNRIQTNQIQFDQNQSNSTSSSQDNPYHVLDVYPDVSSAYHAGSVRALAVSIIPNSFAKLLDSGCSDHMTSNIEDFSSYTPKQSTVSLADGSIINIIGEGSIYGTSNGVLNTFHAYHVPKVNGTLISLGKLMLEGCSLISKGSKFTVIKNQNPILYGSICNGVLELDLTIDSLVMPIHNV